MSPMHRAAPAGRISIPVLVLTLTMAPAAHALRMVNYNLTNYSTTSGSMPARNIRYRTIIAPISPDVVVVQEMISAAGVDSFLSHVLNTIEPGQWAAAPFFNGNDTDSALFYKPAKVQMLGAWAFYPKLPILRLVTVWRLKPIGYTSQAAELRIYSQHLKASMGYEPDRLSEAIGIRDSMNAMPPGTHAILCGDFNIYTSAEPAFGKLLESQADNDGRLYDPLNAPGDWNNNGAFAAIHTQCPCLNNCPAGFGFAGGGMDDRFDMLLPTYPMKDGTGLELLSVTYKPVGNDGQHFNKDINAAPVIPEGQPYADALVFASDHLPVRVDIQLPARITGLPASLAFGTVIVGATATQNVSLSNTVTVPGDGLDYSFTADAGFTAPGGGFSLSPGAGPVLHAINMSTATAGIKLGQLHVASDDPDHLNTNVGLSGTVLGHAEASLDSVVATPTDTLDLGDHSAGAFADGSVRVHNRGYNSLQARLAVNAGTITGGEDRFTIVGGFNPALLAGVGQSYLVHFDDTGATANTTYFATLTFTSGDEALPGAQPQPDLVVTLRARVLAPVDASNADLVTTTRLYNPFPNPPIAGTTVRFDLALATPVRIEAFDVAGRRVATLADRAYPRGAYSVRWNGRNDAGEALGSGIYFVRMRGPGISQTVRLTILR